MYRSLMILVAIMLIFYAAVPAVSAGSQTWHLLGSSSGRHEQDYTGTEAIDSTTHHKDFFMNKTGNAAGDHMRLPNVTKKTTWWYAEYPAQADGLTFGEDNWIVNISHGPTYGCTIWANVCKVNDSTGEVTYLANGSVSPSTSARVSNIICHDNPNTKQIFNTSERLALRIYHNKTKTLYIYYYNTTKGFYSNLTSPASDPGYPTSPTIEPIPEFTTIAIPIAIVLGLMFLFRRRKQKS